TVMASKRKQAGEDAVARERARPARVSQPSRSAERAVRQPSAVGTPPAGEASGSPDRDGLVAVTAPLLGTFYRSPAPGKPPFVEVGSEVEAADSVCIVEVMKLFNQVTAGNKGRIAEIVATDGAMVEFGQTLMWIEPVDVSVGGE
ncbi:MAG: acetyl-CoA carboxylase biotin carboxyl carrier protein, partial [Sciscionella sp.]